MDFHDFSNFLGKSGKNLIHPPKLLCEPMAHTRPEGPAECFRALSQAAASQTPIVAVASKLHDGLRQSRKKRDRLTLPNFTANRKTTEHCTANRPPLEGQ
jgi:hypothetical protein